MTRLVLAVLLASAVLGVGLYAASVQSRNYQRGAELDRLQRESEWHLRQSSGLRAQIERMDFALCVQQNASQERSVGIVLGGSE
ncbi:MAG: hypothetical protein O2816_04890 [Planctomycetota bacterium]|nr:hypothetical protein [Planctomycetota bacterium]